MQSETVSKKSRLYFVLFMLMPTVNKDQSFLAYLLWKFTFYFTAGNTFPKRYRTKTKGPFLYTLVSRSFGCRKCCCLYYLGFTEDTEMALTVYEILNKYKGERERKETF